MACTNYESTIHRKIRRIACSRSMPFGDSLSRAVRMQAAGRRRNVPAGGCWADLLTVGGHCLNPGLAVSAMTQRARVDACAHGAQIRHSTSWAHSERTLIYAGKDQSWLCVVGREEMGNHRVHAGLPCCSIISGPVARNMNSSTLRESEDWQRLSSDRGLNALAGHFSLLLVYRKKTHFQICDLTLFDKI
jgi:hypothetical protein